ncbi:MAG: glycosyltransferase family 2 protein, partial [Elusimicrobiota bacterium]
MANYPYISIVICTFNRCEYLKKCLDSINFQDYPKKFLEIAVLDDASTDGTKKEIPSYLQALKEQGFNEVNYISNEERQGIAVGRWILGNKVSSKSEMALFVDDDAYLEKNCLVTLVEYMLTHSEVGVTGPRIVYAHNPGKTAHRANFVNSWTAQYSEKDSNVPMTCDWLFTICLLVRSSVLKETGGFYPGFYISHQEVDFCLRVKNKGYSVVYNPNAMVQHHESENQQKRERLYYLYRNKLIIIHRNFTLIKKIFAFLILILLGFPKYL